MKNDMPADWFNNALVDGLELIYALALRNAPAASVLPLTTTGWIETLWRKPIAWDQKLDADRIAKGFVSLGGAITEWPAPAMLMQHLPPRSTAAPRLAAPAPTLSPERRRELGELRRRLADHLTQQPATRSHGVKTDTRNCGGDELDHAANAGGKIDGSPVMAPADVAAHRASWEQ